MVNQLPPDAVFSAFSIGRMQLPYVAMAVLAGGNVRVGLEDNLYLRRGEQASNGVLVERAVEILEAMNVRVLGPEEVRTALGLGGVADGAVPRTVGLLGAGVIGAGWAARFLLHGVDVRLYDPDARAEEHVRVVHRERPPCLRRLMTAPLPAEGDLTVAASPEEAARRRRTSSRRASRSARS